MNQLLLIPILNTLVLMAWGKYLNYIDAFRTDKSNQSRILWFIISGSLLNTLIIAMMYLQYENNLFSLNGHGLNYLIIVGTVKEFSKIIIFIFFSYIYNSIKRIRDGVIQAVSITFGFSLVENFIYALSYGPGFFILHSLVALIGHIALAVLWGFAWSAAVYTPTPTGSRFYSAVAGKG